MQEISEMFEIEGAEVYFLKLSTKEGEKVGEIARNGKVEGATAKMLVKLICDSEGERVFKDADLPIIDKMPIAISSEMLKKALEFNKLLPKSLEEETKN